MFCHCRWQYTLNFFTCLVIQNSDVCYFLQMTTHGEQNELKKVYNGCYLSANTKNILLAKKIKKIFLSNNIK